MDVPGIFDDLLNAEEVAMFLDGLGPDPVDAGPLDAGPGPVDAGFVFFSFTGEYGISFYPRLIVDSIGSATVEHALGQGHGLNADDPIILDTDSANFKLITMLVNNPEHDGYLALKSFMYRIPMFVHQLRIACNYLNLTTFVNTEYALQMTLSAHVLMLHEQFPVPWNGDQVIVRLNDQDGVITSMAEMHHWGSVTLNNQIDLGHGIFGDYMLCVPCDLVIFDILRAFFAFTDDPLQQSTHIQELLMAGQNVTPQVEQLCAHLLIVPDGILAVINQEAPVVVSDDGLQLARTDTSDESVVG